MVDYRGKPAFLVGAVCKILGLTDPSAAVLRLDDNQKGPTTIRTLGGPQTVNVVTESGFYQLNLTSRKPAAKRFARWVTDHVLPEIRKTGGYGTNQRIEHLTAENAHLQSALTEQTVRARAAAKAVDRLLVENEQQKAQIQRANATMQQELQLVHDLYIAGMLQSSLPQERLALQCHPFTGAKIEAHAVSAAAALVDAHRLELAQGRKALPSSTATRLVGAPLVDVQAIHDEAHRDPIRHLLLRLDDLETTLVSGRARSSARSAR